MTIQQIKAEYQPVLDSLASDKKELLAQRLELMQAQSILLKNGLDDFGVYCKIREIEEKVNAIIDDEVLINKEINRQINYLQKLVKTQKEEQALNAGIDAYHESIRDGSFVAVCPFSAKYLKKAWKKGYDFQESLHGALGGIQYAA